jgi:DNA-directed RNA polymerase specialized sigma24 family protein
MVCQVPTPEATVRQLRLCDHDLRRSLVLFARKRLPNGDAEDVVQDTLTDALAATQAPEDPLELRKWVFGIARRRVADHVAGMPRGQAMAQDSDATVLPSGEVDAVDLVRWARSEVEGNPEDLRTLGWIVREGLFGDKLASMAKESGLPHALVRQRVSRLRRLLRQRWATQAGIAAVLLLALGWWGFGSGPTTERADPDDVVAASPAHRATSLREEAEAACRVRDWYACTQYLDEAKVQDPDGERSERVVRMRALIERQVVVPAPTTSAWDDVPDRTHPPRNGKAPALTGAQEKTEPCVCPDYDPMCGCLPGMGRSVVPPDP